MSRYLVSRIESRESVEVLRHTEVRSLSGAGRLEGAVVENGETGAERELPVRAIFVFIGAAPHTGWLKGALALDDDGFIVTGRALERNRPEAEEEARAPAQVLFETSRPGVFAAGDVRAGSVKRVASAVGEGAIAVKLVHEHLAAIR